MLVLASGPFMPEKAARPQIVPISLVASLCALMISISVRGIIQRLSLVKTSPPSTAPYPPFSPEVPSLSSRRTYTLCLSAVGKIVLVFYAHGLDLDFLIFNFRLLFFTGRPSDPPNSLFLRPEDHSSNTPVYHAPNWHRVGRRA